MVFPPSWLGHPKHQTGCSLQPPDSPFHSPVGQLRCTELLCFQRTFHSMPEPPLWVWAGRFLASCHFDLQETSQLHFVGDWELRSELVKRSHWVIRGIVSPHVPSGNYRIFQLSSWYPVWLQRWGVSSVDNSWELFIMSGG